MFMRAKKLIFLFALLLVSYACASPRSVKVGFFANSGYHEILSNGQKSGYGYELLSEISRFADLNYEFVGYDKNWDDMLEMLRKGEIDLVSSAQKKIKDGTPFDYSLPVGPDSNYIVVRKSDKALLDEINYGIRQMDMVEPNWKNRLYLKYYGSENLAYSVFNERERVYLKDFLRQNRTLKVTVQNVKAPYAYVENGVAKGILLDIFAEIARPHDLKYEFVVPAANDTDNVTKIKKWHIVLDGHYGMAGGDDGWVFTPLYLRDLVLDGYDSLLYGMRIAVPRDAPREVTSILTKGVLMLSPKSMREYVVKYAGFRMPNYSGKLLQIHSRAAAVFGAVLGILGLALIASLVWIAVRRKLKNRQEVLDSRLRDAEAFAAEAKEAKSKFLLNMSHDIRTPMNAIIGYSERAERHLENKTDVLDALKKIRISGGYLLQLIEEVLDMAKIESGRVLLKERMMNITSCMTEFCEGCMPMMNHKNISFIWDFSVIKNKFVIANVSSLRQILYNIISNAQKFTPYGGRVVFTIEELPCRVDGYAVYDFEISDNGLGMSKEFLDHIYDEFSREQSSTQSGVQGTGLGMSIVKHLVDMMGAEISIQSEVGLGTTVRVRTQFKIATESDVSIDGCEHNSVEVGDFLKGKRVLLVEDNEFNREVALDFLQDAQMTVEIAENGLEAVAKVKEHAPDYYDCILMDIQMPVMDGYEATRAIRQAFPQAKIPIIAVSANAFEEDRQKSLAAGMDDHLAKPIVVAKVFESMYSLMQRKINEK